METILFIGIPATGKSTFYKMRFFRTHIRINLDMLRTRHRELIFLNACLQAHQPFVIDNTNVTVEDRSGYIEAAKAAGFKVIGYYFQSRIQEARLRNANRDEAERIPDVGILGKAGLLELPTYAEGFDALYYVRIGEDNHFIVQDWQHEL